jgi:hypothetical protein
VVSFYDRSSTKHSLPLHADVGGGSVPNDTPNSLARIPLRWMIRECFKTKSGIMFDAAKLREVGLDPDRLYPEVSKRPERLPVGSAKVQNIPPPGKPPKVAHDSTQSEEAHELNDAMSPAFDQLEAKWGWWLLDLLPLGKTYQNADDVWVTTIQRVLSLSRTPFLSDLLLGLTWGKDGSSDSSQTTLSECTDLCRCGWRRSTRGCMGRNTNLEKRGRQARNTSLNPNSQRSPCGLIDERKHSHSNKILIQKLCTTIHVFMVNTYVNIKLAISLRMSLINS